MRYGLILASVIFMIADAESVDGVLRFRGNAANTFYGKGPVPHNPVILWRYPEEEPMEGESSVHGEVKLWQGSGWTGQPVVVEREGDTWVIFGAYDYHVHFLDAETGKELRESFPTDDLIKASVAYDPDGYPLIYFGSRDNYFRILALDRPSPTEVWKLSAYAVKRAVWNNDWDCCPQIQNGYLFLGGENSNFLIIRLNRGYDGYGKVTVSPEIVLEFPAFDADLFEKLGDENVSIENSPALFDKTVYFANSGGMVYGIDYSSLHSGGGGFPLSLKFWMGDDVDASIVVDDEGMLYVCAELERDLPRAIDVGQIVKLNPKHPEAPRVWSINVPSTEEHDGGVWATPALHRGVLFVATNPGDLLAIDAADGRILWRKKLTPHLWSSPVVVDDTLIVCDAYGFIRAYDVRRPRIAPPQLWKIKIAGGGVIESTPAVWKGRIYVGAKDGYFYCIGDEEVE